MVHLCGLIEYAYVNILPQITQITQRGMQQAALFRRERQVGEVKAVLLFCNLSAIISEITSPIVGIFLQRLHIISNLFVSSQL